MNHKSQRNAFICGTEGVFFIENLLLEVKSEDSQLER